VILATSSAVAAGDNSAVPLLRQALQTSADHFWDEKAGMVVEQCDRSFSALDPYRGVNANMHTVEAYLAAADVLELSLADSTAALWRERACRIIERVVNCEARRNDWRVPEHFTPGWTPLLDYNQDRPADPFRPYGATVGHGLEWSRLTLQARAGLADPPPWMADAACHLYDRALADGWAVDGADGFVYTTDWSGAPVVHERMHWVLAEAIGASAALTTAGLKDCSDDAARWWRYAEAYLIDHVNGSWHHELNRYNQVSTTVWDGKPDVYHALQATLLPQLPLAPAIAPALAGGA